MENRDALIIAIISAVVAVGVALVTGWSSGNPWTIPLIAFAMFIVLGSITEYRQARHS